MENYRASKSYIIVNVTYKSLVGDLAVEHYLASRLVYSKTCLKRPLKKKTKIGFQDRLTLNAGQKYCRMLQESILQYLQLQFVIKPFVLSIFELPLKTGFTV